MKISCSDVTMHRAFLWPVLGSASVISVHRLRFTVPCGKVLSCRRVRASTLNTNVNDSQTESERDLRGSQRERGAKLKSSAVVLRTTSGVKMPA